MNHISSSSHQLTTKKYEFVTGPVGCGKTSKALQFAGQMAEKEWNVAFVQPSIHLIKESIAKFRKEYPNVLVSAIHSENLDNPVRELVEYTNSAGSGEILFITHSAFIRCPRWNRPEDWITIIDEAPEIFSFDELTIPANHNVIIPALSVISVDNRYSRLIPGDEKLLENISKNDNIDEVFKVFQEVARKITSDMWDTYVLNEQWDRFMSNNITDGKLFIFSILRPHIFDGFRSVIFMSANFESTLLYLHLKEHGYCGYPHNEIGAQMNDAKHQNGNLLRVHYAIEGSTWSKTLRKKTVEVDDEEITVNNIILNSTKKILGDREYAWLLNKDLWKQEIFDQSGVRLPHRSHGINDFRHIHYAVILPALNPRSYQYAFLQQIGKFESHQIRRAIYHEGIYQAAGRISLREPHNKDFKNVIVADLECARFLQDLFPGSTLHRLPGVDDLLPKPKRTGRPPLHDSAAERNKSHRKNRRQVLLQDVEEMESYFDGFSDTKLPLYNKVFSSRWNGILGGSWFSEKYSTDNLSDHEAFEFDDFVARLREYHKRKIDKDKAGLWSPAVFDVSMSESTKRGLDNITRIWGIWLDNDGGDLSINEFVDMFPYVKMIIHNSISSIQKNPKWRVIIPTTCPMTKDVHKQIIELIKKCLQNNGYYDSIQMKNRANKAKIGKCHGFDPSKFTPSSLFYLPSQAKVGPEDSFFHIIQGEDRKPINPRAWIENIQNDYSDPEYDEIIEQHARSDFKEKIDRSGSNPPDVALTRWRTHSQGTGHREFFILAVALCRSGMSENDARNILHEEAIHSHGRQSVRDRRREISNSIKKIYK